MAIALPMSSQSIIYPLSFEMAQWSHRSYPQGSPTPERLFVLCIDIRMDESIVLLVGGTAPEEKERK
jgi:hypothetical protein